MNIFKRLSLSRQGKTSDTSEQQQGKLIKRFGQKGRKKGQLDSPGGIALTKSGGIVVSDCLNHRIQIFSQDGSFKSKFGGEGSKPHNLQHPRGLDVTSDDLIAVADIGNAAVKIFTQRGKLDRCFQDLDRIRMPNDLSITHDGYFVLTDISKHCVIVLSPLGDISHSFNSHVKDTEELDHPYYVATNSRKEILVSDADNKTIKIFTFKGTLLHAFCQEDFKAPPSVSVYMYLTGVTYDWEDNSLACCGGNIFILAKSGRLLEILNESDGLDLPMYLVCSDSGRVFATQVTPDSSEILIFHYNKDDYRDALKRLQDEDNSEGTQSNVEGEGKEGDDGLKDKVDEENRKLDQAQGTTNPDISP